MLAALLRTPKPIEEQPLEPMEAVAALVERGDRVAERRRLGIGCNGADFGAVRMHRMEKCGKVVLGFDLVEGRQSVRRFPWLQQRIGGGVGHGS